MYAMEIKIAVDIDNIDKDRQKRKFQINSSENIVEKPKQCLYLWLYSL